MLGGLIDEGAPTEQPMQDQRHQEKAQRDPRIGVAFEDDFRAFLHANLPNCFGRQRAANPMETRINLCQKCRGTTFRTPSSPQSVPTTAGPISPSTAISEAASPCALRR